MITPEMKTYLQLVAELRRQIEHLKDFRRSMIEVNGMSPREYDVAEQAFEEAMADLDEVESRLKRSENCPLCYE